MPRPVEGEIKMFQGLKNKAIRFLLERTCPDVFTIKAMLSKVTRKEMQFYVDQFYSKKEG